MGRVMAVPRLCELYPGTYLTTEKKHGKPSVRVAEECQMARWKQNIQNRTHVTIRKHKQKNKNTGPLRTTTHGEVYHNTWWSVSQHMLKCITTHVEVYHNTRWSVSQHTVKCTTTHIEVYPVCKYSTLQIQFIARTNKARVKKCCKYEGETNENLKYVLSRNLLNTKCTKWLHVSM